MESVSVSRYVDDYRINQYPIPNPEECRLLTFQLANRPDVINRIHSISPKLDGCFMEALLAFAFGCNVELLKDSISNYHLVSTRLIKQIRNKLCSDIQNNYKVQRHFIELGIERQLNEFFLSTLSGNLLSLFNGNQPDEFILFYCLAYVINDNRDRVIDENSSIETCVRYLTELLNNFTEVYRYITDIKDKFNSLFRNTGVPKYHVPCTIQVDNYLVTGECDFVFSNILIDVKAWSANDDCKYLRQLELYNHSVKKQAVAIINVFKNELILYSKFDHLETYLTHA